LDLSALNSHGIALAFSASRNESAANANLFFRILFVIRRVSAGGPIGVKNHDAAPRIARASWFEINPRKRGIR